MIPPGLMASRSHLEFEPFISQPHVDPIGSNGFVALIGTNSLTGLVRRRGTMVMVCILVV